MLLINVVNSVIADRPVIIIYFILTKILTNLYIDSFYNTMSYVRLVEIYFQCLLKPIYAINGKNFIYYNIYTEIISLTMLNDSNISRIAF